MQTEDLLRIDRVLVGATCWGAELDTRYRVLAATIEPAADRHPDGAPADPRLQLVLHPCADVQARLVHEGHALERFEVEQLLAVVERLDGPVIGGPVVTAGGPPLRGQLSLEGRADVQDGRAHTAMVVLTGDDRELTLRVTYDEAELRRPDGSVIDLG